MYGTPENPYRHHPGRPRKLHRAAIKRLLRYQLENPWAYQDELAMYLEEEWDMSICQKTISNTLKREGISRKKGERVGPQSQQQRTA